MKKILISMLFVFFMVTPAQAVSMFDLTFNLGPSLSQSGNITELGDPNLSTGFGFNFYFKPNHGIGFSFNNESSFDGEDDLRGLDDASISTFDLHYAYRYMKNKFQFIVEPGIGTQTLYGESFDPYWGYVYQDDVSTALVLNLKLFARYVLTEWNSGEDTSTGHFFVGGGLLSNYSMNDDLHGKDISGNRLAMLFQVGLGF